MVVKEAEDDVAAAETKEEELLLWGCFRALAPNSQIKSKVHLSPKLGYLRLSIIEAQDHVAGDKGCSTSMVRFPKFFAKAQIGNQVLRTRISMAVANRRLCNSFWNESLMFVVAEPFEDYLLISVENGVAPGREEVVGFGSSSDSKNVSRFGSRIHIRASLDRGYHVLDEATMYSSDLRPLAKQLWKPHIGVLEMGILGATKWNEQDT
ncbi:C2 domain [Dillenia turbinata]|uniref:C2 domain n=1 Tax=Dillenia turbinata TaxID=194707 RepID=A0AAN8VZA5_9MAGN